MEKQNKNICTDADLTWRSRAQAQVLDYLHGIPGVTCVYMCLGKLFFNFMFWFVYL
jgi:hypothetical protein